MDRMGSKHSSVSGISKYQSDRAFTSVSPSVITLMIRPKSNYTEKFTQIIFSISFELKQALTKKEILKFNLELIESQEITCECNINILPNKEKDEGKNKLLYPKVYYINIQKNIFEFDRDILLLKQDPDNKYITPFFSSNINIDKKDNSQKTKKLQKFTFNLESHLLAMT